MWKELKKWCSENRWSIGIAILFGIVAGAITGIFIYFSLLKENWNYVLLFSAVFGGGLAIWGRINTQRQLDLTQEQMKNTERQMENTERQMEATEKQLEATEKQLDIAEKQIELNRKSNNNEIFAKGVEIICDNNIESKEGFISIVAGLQMITKLATNDSGNEYIRCVEFICTWLKLFHFGNKTAEPMPFEIRDVACNFLIEDFNGKHLFIENYIDKRNFASWPHLQFINFNQAYLHKVNLSQANLCGTNFEKANLSNANLQRARLLGPNLENADITHADMSHARELKAKDILSAKWYNYNGTGEPPKLPKELLDDERIQKWLSEPHGEMI